MDEPLIPDDVDLADTLDNAREAVAGFFTDPRRVVGLIVIGTLAGFVIGYRLAAGAPPMPDGSNPFAPGYVGGPVPDRPHRCVECEEQRIRQAQGQPVDLVPTPDAARINAAAGLATDTPPMVVDPPAPVGDTTPAGEPFSHTDVAASAATFSPLAPPGPGPDAAIGVPVEPTP